MSERRQYDPDHCTACGDFLPCGESWLDTAEVGRRVVAAESMNQTAANRGRGVPMTSDPDTTPIPAILQDALWLMDLSCGHVQFAPSTDPHNPRPSGKPRAGDRCPECVKHGPNHGGRLVVVRAHLEVLA